MGNLKAVTSESEYDVISNEPWVNGRIYFLKSDADEGATLSVTVTFTDKNKYSETQGVVDLELPKVNVLNGNYYYSFPSDIIELFGGTFTARTPTPTPEQETPTPTPIAQFGGDNGGHTFSTKSELQTAVNEWVLDETNAILTYGDISTWNVSAITDMSNLFTNKSNITTLDLSGWDTSNVTSLAYMFRGCSSLTSLDLSNFDTSDVTNMDHMFSNCTSLTSLDVSNFDTSDVTDMGRMFHKCFDLTSLDLSSFDTSSVTDMAWMFTECSALTSLDLSSFDTSNVTSMISMFSSCLALTSLDLSSFDTSGVTGAHMPSMFWNCKNLTSLDVSNFDTGGVTDMGYLFKDCQNLTSLDLSSFDTSSVTEMDYMFSGCWNLTSLDLSSFDTSSATNMETMFRFCLGLTSLDLSNWCVTEITEEPTDFAWQSPWYATESNRPAWGYCPVVGTITGTTAIGDDTLNVSNSAEFTIGDQLVIDRGTSLEETTTIINKGSLVIYPALTKSHADTATVESRPALPTPTPTPEQTPTPTLTPLNCASEHLCVTDVRTPDSDFTGTWNKSSSPMTITIQTGPSVWSNSHSEVTINSYYYHVGSQSSYIIFETPPLAKYSSGSMGSGTKGKAWELRSVSSIGDDAGTLLTYRPNASSGVNLDQSICIEDIPTPNYSPYVFATGYSQLFFEATECPTPTPSPTPEQTPTPTPIPQASGDNSNWFTVDSTIFKFERGFSTGEYASKIILNGLEIGSAPSWLSTNYAGSMYYLLIKKSYIDGGGTLLDVSVSYDPSVLFSYGDRLWPYVSNTIDSSGSSLGSYNDFVQINSKGDYANNLYSNGSHSDNINSFETWANGEDLVFGVMFFDNNSSTSQAEIILPVTVSLPEKTPTPTPVPALVNNTTSFNISDATANMGQPYTTIEGTYEPTSLQEFADGEFIYEWKNTKNNYRLYIKLIGDTNQRPAPDLLTDSISDAWFCTEDCVDPYEYEGQTYYQLDWDLKDGNVNVYPSSNPVDGERWNAFSVNMGDITVVYGEAPTPTPIPCLESTSDVTIDQNNNYVFGGVYTPRYKLNTGRYRLENIPSDHPIFINGSISSGIHIEGPQTTSGSYGTGYFGNAEIVVTANFSVATFRCANHGKMGSSDNLMQFEFNSECAVGHDTTTLPTPTPERTPTPTPEQPTPTPTPEAPTPTPEAPTPTPRQPLQTSTIDWLTTTAKLKVNPNSATSVSDLYFENTTFNWSSYPFKSYNELEFSVYVVRGSFSESAEELTNNEYSYRYATSMDLSAFREYDASSNTFGSLFVFGDGSNSFPDYGLNKLVAGLNSGSNSVYYPTNQTIGNDPNYFYGLGYSDFDTWLGDDTEVKVVIIVKKYDQTRGEYDFLETYCIECELVFDPTPTPEPPLPELETWLTFDSSKFFTDADTQSNGDAPYRLVLENVKITEANIPSKIKNAISSNKLRVTCYAVKDTYTGSLFTPIGSDSMGSNIDTTVFFTYGDLSNQVNEHGTYNSSLNWNDQVRMGSFWNFYSDFANGLTVGSATYGYDSDDFNAWKGTDGIKLGFGIAIANSDTDYEVLYNKRYNLPIATFVEQTPTPLPPFLLDASQITYIVTGTSGFEIQGPYNSYIQQSLDNYGGSVGYKNNAYKLALVLNANVSLKTSDNQIIPGLKIYPGSDWNQVLNGVVEPVESVYNRCFVLFDGDVGNVSVFNGNTKIIEDLFVYSEQAPEGSYLPPDLPTPTPDIPIAFNLEATNTNTIGYNGNVHRGDVYFSISNVTDRIIENDYIAYNSGIYKFNMSFTDLPYVIKLVDANKNTISGLTIYQTGYESDLENRTISGRTDGVIRNGLNFIEFSGDIGNISIYNSNTNTILAQDILKYSSSAPTGGYSLGQLKTPTPTPEQTPTPKPVEFSEWFEFDEIKLNVSSSTTESCKLEFTNLQLKSQNIPTELSDAISSQDMLITYKIVKENDTSNVFGFASILSKYTDETIDSETTLNFYQDISGFQTGNYVAEISNTDNTYGDWLSTDNVKIQILVVDNNNSTKTFEYNEIYDIDLVTQDFITRMGPSTLFNNFIFDYELVDNVADLNTNLTNGDFILTKNDTKLVVNMTNKVFGQLNTTDSSEFAKNDPRAKIKSLHLGGRYDFQWNTFTSGPLGSDMMGSVALTHFINLNELTLANQTMLTDVAEIDSLNALEYLYITNSTPVEKNIELINSVSDETIDFSNFVLPNNLKHLEIYSSNTLNPFTNLPNSLEIFKTNMVQDLKLLSSNDSNSSFVSGSCESSDTSSSINVNSFTNIKELYLSSCENFTDLKCKFPSLLKLKIANTTNVPQTEEGFTLTQLPNTLTELDISNTSVMDIQTGYPTSLQTLIARNSSLAEFKVIPTSLVSADLTATPIADDSDKFEISGTNSTLNQLILDDFTYIPTLTNLNALTSLDMDLKDASISDLPTMPGSLETLRITNAGFSNISSLSSCSNLSSVDLSYNSISDLSSLSNSATSLKTLKISNNNVTNGNFASFNNLNALYATSNNLENLSLPAGIKIAEISENLFSTATPTLSNLSTTSLRLQLYGDLDSAKKQSIIQSIPSDVSITLEVEDVSFPNATWWLTKNVFSLKLSGTCSTIIPSACRVCTFNDTNLTSLDLSSNSFASLNITNNELLTSLNTGNDVDDFYFSGNPNIETFIGNPNVSSLSLSLSKLKTLEVPESLQTLQLDNCKELGSGTASNVSPITFNDSYNYVNLKRITINESELSKERIQAIFKEFSDLYDKTTNNSTDPGLQGVTFEYIGNSKRPTTADADYLNLKTNAEWQFKPFDPELAQYITLPDNETVVIDNVSTSEKEPTFVNTNTNTADLVVNDSNVGMMGVFPNPFFFGNQRWDYYEIGVTKLVSIGNLNTINITWLGYGSIFVSMHDSGDKIKIEDLTCIPTEIKLSKGNVSDILREGDEKLLDTLSSTDYIKIESEDTELFASQYEPMTIGGNDIIINVDDITQNDALKIKFWRGSNLNSATDVTTQVAWSNNTLTNVNGSQHGSFYGSPNAYSANGTSQVYVNSLTSLNVDFVSFEFADGRTLPQGYNDGIQFKYYSECTEDITPTPTPFSDGTFENWISTSSTPTFQVYGPTDVDSQEKPVFIQFDDLRINRFQLHNDIDESSLFQIKLYVIDKSSHGNEDYGTINQPVTSDHIICSSFFMTTQLTDALNSLSMSNTFADQNEYGWHGNSGIHYDSNTTIVNEETAYHRVHKNNFIKNVDEYDNLVLVYEVVELNYTIFGGPTSRYHKFETSLQLGEWGFPATPTPTPEPPTPTPVTELFDWSIYSNDIGLDAIMAEFTDQQLQNVTDSHPGFESNFTGVFDGRDSNNTGWTNTWLNGLMHGYSYQYDNGVLIRSSRQYSGNIVGESIRWYPSGAIREVTVYSDGNYKGRILWYENQDEPYIDELRNPRITFDSVVYGLDNFGDIAFNIKVENPDLYPANSFELQYIRQDDLLYYENMATDSAYTRSGHTITFNLSEVTLDDINSSSDKMFEYIISSPHSSLIKSDVIHYRIKGIGSVDGQYNYLTDHYIDAPTPTPTPTPTPEQTPTPIPQDQTTPTPDMTPSRWIYSPNHKGSFDMPTGSILTNKISKFTNTGIISVFEYTISNDPDNQYFKVCEYTNNASSWTELGSDTISYNVPTDLASELSTIFSSNSNNITVSSVRFSTHNWHSEEAIRKIVILENNTIKAYHAYQHFQFATELNSDFGFSELKIPVVIEYTWNNSEWKYEGYKIIYKNNNSSNFKIISTLNGGSNNPAGYYAKISSGCIFSFDDKTESFAFYGKFYDDDGYFNDEVIQVYVKSNNTWNLLGNAIQQNTSMTPVVFKIDNQKIQYNNSQSIYFMSYDTTTYDTPRWTNYSPTISLAEVNLNQLNNYSNFDDNKLLLFDGVTSIFRVYEKISNSWNLKYSIDLGSSNYGATPQVQISSCYLNDDFEIIYNFNSDAKLLNKNQNKCFDPYYTGIKQPIPPIHYSENGDYFTDVYLTGGIGSGSSLTPAEFNKTPFKNALGNYESRHLTANETNDEFILVTKIPQAGGHNLLDLTYNCIDSDQSSYTGNTLSNDWSSAWKEQPQTQTIWELRVFPNQTSLVLENANDAMGILNPWDTTNPQYNEHFVVSQSISTMIGSRYEVSYYISQGNTTVDQSNGVGFARTTQFDRNSTIAKATTTGFTTHYFQFVATHETTYIEFGTDDLSIPSYIYAGQEYYTTAQHNFNDIRVSLVEETIEVNVFNVPSLSTITNLNGNVIDGYVKNAPGQLIDVSTGNVVKEFTSDQFGRWTLNISPLELPDLYKIKFLPGGTDILTNKIVNTSFSNIAKKEDALVSSTELNITPITTLKSAIVETKIQQKKDSGETYDLNSIISTTKTFVANKFDISESDLELDYIEEQKTDVLKANTKLSVITQTLKSTVSAVDSNVTEDAIFASIATEFENVMASEETSSANISVTDLLSNNIQTIVRNSVDESIEDQITSDSSIVQNIEFISEVVLEVIDTPSDSESTDSFADSLQAVRKEVLSTIEFVEEVVSTSDISDTTVDTNKDTALESIDDAIELVEDVVIDDIIQPTPTPTPIQETPTPTPLPTPTPHGPFDNLAQMNLPTRVYVTAKQESSVPSVAEGIYTLNMQPRVFWSGYDPTYHTDGTYYYENENNYRLVVNLTTNRPFDSEWGDVGFYPGSSLFTNTLENGQTCPTQWENCNERLANTSDPQILTSAGANWDNIIVSRVSSDGTAESSDEISESPSDEDATPTATFASYYFVEEPQSNSYTFNKYHEDEYMLAYDTMINGKLFDVLIMKSDGFVELYIGSVGASGASLGTLQPEYQSNHSNGLNWVNYFISTYEGLSISSTSNQNQINIVIPDSLLDMAETA